MLKLMVDLARYVNCSGKTNSLLKCKNNEKGGMVVVDNRPTNSKSIISLTLGILSIFIPMIGLVLGIIGIIVSTIALKEMAKTNGIGRGLAISGMICSVVGLITQAFQLIGIFAFYSFGV